MLDHNIISYLLLALCSYFYYHCFVSLCHIKHPLLFYAAFFIGTESKMKLWDVLAMCLLLLSSVATRPLYQNSQPAKRTYFPSSYSDPASLSVEDKGPTFERDNQNLQEISTEDQCKAEHPCFDTSFCDAPSQWWCVEWLIIGHVEVTLLLHVQRTITANSFSNLRLNTSWLGFLLLRVC